MQLWIPNIRFFIYFYTQLHKEVTITAQLINIEYLNKNKMKQYTIILIWEVVLKHQYKYLAQECDMYSHMKWRLELI
jgi:hypothetical protein